MSKQFLAVGDYLINPELLTYAVLEQGSAEPRLRLGFSTRSSDADGELRLTGDVAREVLRWLRLNAIFLSTNGGFGSIGNQVGRASEACSVRTARNAKGTIGDSWQQWDSSQTEDAGRLLSRTGELS